MFALLLFLLKIEVIILGIGLMLTIAAPVMVALFGGAVIIAVIMVIAIIVLAVIIAIVFGLGPLIMYILLVVGLVKMIKRKVEEKEQKK